MSAARQELAVRRDRHVEISYDCPVDLHDRAGLARPNVEQLDAADGKAGGEGQQCSVRREDGRQVDRRGVGQRLLPFSFARGRVPQADHALHRWTASRVRLHADDTQRLSVGEKPTAAGSESCPTASARCDVAAFPATAAGAAARAMTVIATAVNIALSFFGVRQFIAAFNFCFLLLLSHALVVPPLGGIPPKGGTTSAFHDSCT